MSIVSPHDGYFPVTSIHRDDLRDIGFDVANVPDDQMQRLAEKMGELYVEFGGFWQTMEDLAEEMGIPKLKEMGGEKDIEGGKGDGGVEEVRPRSE
jgi:hypothetical protein